MRRACSATDIPTLVLDQPETTGPAVCAVTYRLNLARAGRYRRGVVLLLDRGSVTCRVRRLPRDLTDARVRTEGEAPSARVHRRTIATCTSRRRTVGRWESPRCRRRRGFS